MSIAQSPQPDERVIEAGGPAASQFYNTLDLRHMVYSMLDRSTVVAAMRLEKAGVGSAAAILYRKVHISQAHKMKRESPAQLVYCNAVQVIDKSPHLPLEPPGKITIRDGVLKDPTRFKPKIILRSLRLLRAKFPHLQSVLYQYPADIADDAYVIHIQPDIIVVRLESHAHYDIHFPPPLSPSTELFGLPKTPKHDGMDIRHGLILHLNDRFHTHYSTDATGLGYPNQWKAYIYDNPKLDTRVAGVRPCERMEVSARDILRFLHSRKGPSFHPITDASVVLQSDLGAAGALSEITSALGTELRGLSIRLHGEGAFAQNHIAEVDNAFPHLQELHLLSNDYKDTLSPVAAPLTGLRHLRSLRFRIRHQGGERGALAPQLFRLGAADCLFYNLSARPAYYSGPLNDEIRRLKSEAGPSGCSWFDYAGVRQGQRDFVSKSLTRLSASSLCLSSISAIIIPPRAPPTRIDTRQLMLQAFVAQGLLPAQYANIPPYELDNWDDYAAGPVSAPAGSIASQHQGSIQRRKVAARKVYQSLEIRRCIYGMMDRRTLVKMLRVQKAALGDVAGVLYERIHETMVKKFTRANIDQSRRAIYCAAVQVIDDSSYPKHKNPLNAGTGRPKHIYHPHRAHPKNLRSYFTDYQKDFPHLRKVLYHYPVEDRDDAWTIQLRGGRLHLDVETRFVFDIMGVHPPTRGDFDAESDIFPPIPSRSDMDIRQTITLKLVDHSTRAQKAAESVARAERIEKWRSWLYLNPHLDRRIASIDHSECSGLSVSLDEIKAFVGGRRAHGCEPPTSLFIPREPIRPATVVALLNPELRSLFIPEEALWSFRDAGAALTAIDKAAPYLHNLTILYPSTKPSTYRPLLTSPIRAFPHLRCFTYRPGGPVGSRGSAGHLVNFGSSECIYQNLDLPVKEMKMFTDLVKLLKRGMPEDEDDRYGSDGYYSDDVDPHPRAGSSRQKSRSRQSWW